MKQDKVLQVCYEDQTVVEELRTEMDKFYLKTLD